MAESGASEPELELEEDWGSRRLERGRFQGLGAPPVLVSHHGTGRAAGSSVLPELPVIPADLLLLLLRLLA